MAAAASQIRPKVKTNGHFSSLMQVNAKDLHGPNKVRS